MLVTYYRCILTRCHRHWLDWIASGGEANILYLYSGYFHTISYVDKHNSNRPHNWVQLICYLIRRIGTNLNLVDLIQSNIPPGNTILFSEIGILNKIFYLWQVRWGRNGSVLSTVTDGVKIESRESGQRHDLGTNWR